MRGVAEVFRLEPFEQPGAGLPLVVFRGLADLVDELDRTFPHRVLDSEEKHALVVFRGSFAPLLIGFVQLLRTRLEPQPERAGGNADDASDLLQRGAPDDRVGDFGDELRVDFAQPHLVPGERLLAHRATSVGRSADQPLQWPTKFA